MSTISPVAAHPFHPLVIQDREQQTAPQEVSWGKRFVKWITAPACLATCAINAVASGFFFMLQNSPCIPPTLFHASWLTLVSSTTGLASLLLLILSNQKIKTLFNRLILDYETVRTSELSLKNRTLKYYGPLSLQISALSSQIATCSLMMTRDSAPCFTEIERSFALYGAGMSSIGTTILQLLSTYLYCRALHDRSGEETKILLAAKTQSRKSSLELSTPPPALEESSGGS